MARTECKQNEAVTDSQTEGLPLADEPIARRFDEVITAWHALLDEVRVQADLAAMALRDDLATRRRLGENAWLAARVYLNDAVADATHGTAVYHPAACVVRDLRRAAEAARGAIQRG